MNSKVNALRKLIREEVQSAIREELNEILSNFQFSAPAQVVQEVKISDKQQTEQARKALAQKMSSVFGTPTPPGAQNLQESYMAPAPVGSNPIEDLLLQTAIEMSPTDRRNHSQYD